MSSLLVRKVSRNAPFCAFVHFSCTNLHFQWLSTWPNNSGVQRLVQIELRHGDVVLEPAHNWPPLTVNTTKRSVTVTHTVDNDAKRN